MALLDWNHNGKDDAFDRFMDYQLLTGAFDDDNDDEEEYDFDAVSSPSSRKTVRKQPVQEDLCGLDEIRGKDTESILRLLVKRKKTMDHYFEVCSVESGFRDVMDNRQMGKDFWLMAFVRQLESGTLNKPQKIQLLQLLLDTFLPGYPMTAKRHYEEMQGNEAYREYMIHCFEQSGDDGTLFWRIFANMSGNEGERTSMTIGYLKEYMKFAIQLEQYLSRMFPGRGFGGHMQKYIGELIDYIGQVMDADSDAVTNIYYLDNPIFPSVL